MGQAGAQREPSMEEILASIRRIIENNDPVEAANAASTSADTGLSPADEDTVASQQNADPDPDHETTATSGSSQEELAETPSDEPSADIAAVLDDHNAEADDTAANIDRNEDDAPVSLADVAARVRAHPETFGEQQGRNASEATDPRRDHDGGSVIDDAVAAELRQALVSDDPVVAVRPAQADKHIGEENGSAARPNDAPVRTPSVSGPVDVAVPPPAPAETAGAVEPMNGAQTQGDVSEHPEEGGQLVSLQTGEKVAAAFGELSAAIQAGQTRSFDEIAQEMLKPMLTQWLDDNLPTLVERLVREEIERVSRGDRR